MKNSKEISEIMLGHHALIQLLFVAFKDTLSKNFESAEKLFDEFRWELDKHIFVEERVIFKFCDKLESETCKIVKNLTKEHDVMLEMLNEAKDKLITRNRVDVLGFEKLLAEHRNVEEKTLYPRLDQELTGMEKEAIIARINEIPIKEEMGAI